MRNSCLKLKMSLSHQPHHFNKLLLQLSVPTSSFLLCYLLALASMGGGGVSHIEVHFFAQISISFPYSTHPPPFFIPLCSPFSLFSLLSVLPLIRNPTSDFCHSAFGYISHPLRLQRYDSNGTRDGFDPNQRKPDATRRCAPPVA